MPPQVSPVVRPLLATCQIERCSLAPPAGRADAGRRGGQRAVSLSAAQFQNAAAEIHGARGHLGNGRVGVGLLRAERKPAGQRGHRLHARAIAIGRAVVVDQPRLDDGVAHAGVVASGQHVVVAQQVLALVCVLDRARPACRCSSPQSGCPACRSPCCCRPSCPAGPSPATGPGGWPGCW